MRFSFIGSVIIVLALVGMAPSSVAAQSARTKTNYGPTCVCLFGYGTNGCVVALACEGEGGHCSKSCVPPDDNQAVH